MSGIFDQTLLYLIFKILFVFDVLTEEQLEYIGNNSHYCTTSAPIHSTIMKYLSVYFALLSSITLMGNGEDTEDVHVGTFDWLGNTLTPYSTDDHDYDEAPSRMRDTFGSMSYHVDDDDFVFDDSYVYSDDTPLSALHNGNSDDNTTISTIAATHVQDSGTSWWGNWGRRMIRRLTDLNDHDFSDKREQVKDRVIIDDADLSSWGWGNWGRRMARRLTDFSGIRMIMSEYDKTKTLKDNGMIEEKRISKRRMIASIRKDRGKDKKISSSNGLNRLNFLNKIKEIKTAQKNKGSRLIRMMK